MTTGLYLLSSTARPRLLYHSTSKVLIEKYLSRIIRKFMIHFMAELQQIYEQFSELSNKGDGVSAVINGKNNYNALALSSFSIII